MTISIFGGRSSHGRSTTRTSSSKSQSRQRQRQRQQTRPTKPRKVAAEEGGDLGGDEGGRNVPVEPEKPDIDELRRRRLLYLSVPPEARRRVSAPAPAPVKISSKPRSTESIASYTQLEQGPHKRRRRRHKSKPSRAEKGTDSARPSRIEDYVYTSPPVPVIQAEPKTESQLDARIASHSSRRLNKTSSTSPRHTLSAIPERDITPDDSISQVCVRPQTSPVRATSSPRLPAKRTSASATKLRCISEQKSDEKSVTTTSHRMGKHSSQPSLLGLMRRHTAPAVPTPPRLVECLTCASDDVPYSKSAKLACGHRMCHECLKRIFEMSVKDPAHMPPKCCTHDHIPLQHVDKLFDLKFKLLWNRKFQEFHTKNRIYCPASKCGEWIKPTHVHSSQGRKYVQCPRCQTKVCTLCNAKLHRAKECPKDPEIARLVEQAKEKGWQTCYSCNAMVELKEGCNHMTCRCLAEFCMICGGKWKTCECPWFNYSQLPDPDRLMDWRVPEPIQMLYQRAFGRPEEAQPRDHLPDRTSAAQPANLQRRATYTDEMDQRRRQERLDANLARRLQLATFLEPEDEPANIRQRRHDFRVDNAAVPLLNDEFVQNAANVVIDAFGGLTLNQRAERRVARR